MRCHRPLLQLAHLLDSPNPRADGFGGTPWGLPEGVWPTASDGNPQSLLMQVTHSVACDLGREGRKLFVFQADDWFELEMDESEDSPDSATIIVEPEDLLDGPTPKPDGVLVRPWVMVAGWDAYDDDVEQGALAAFYDESDFFELDEDASPGLSRFDRDTAKAGGVPVWGGAEEPPARFAPANGWRFLVQFKGDLRFDGSPPAPDALGATVAESAGDDEYRRDDPRKRRAEMPREVLYVRDGNYWTLPFANLALGTGVVFVRSDGEPRAAYICNR